MAKIASAALPHLTEHPFGKGSLTTDGVQYAAETTSAGSAAYVAVPDLATVYRPVETRIKEVELGLTMALKSSNSVETVLWKMQASDDNISWEDLIAEQTAASGAAVSAYADKTIAGRFAPTGNFAGTANPFYVRGVVKMPAAATGTASAKMKNSGYVRLLLADW